MSLKRKNTLVALVGVSLVSMTWFFLSDNEQNPPDETSQVEACDSCTARHRNLTRLRDARNLTAVTGE